MESYVDKQISFLFDFNVVITNLNKIDKAQALALVEKLRESIVTSAQTTDEYAKEYSTIPLVGRTIFEQQKLLYHSLLQCLNQFESKFKIDN